MAIKLSLSELFSHSTLWPETSEKFRQGGWHLSCDHGMFDQDGLQFEVWVPGENARNFEELFPPEQVNFLTDYGLYLEEVDTTF